MIILLSMERIYVTEEEVNLRSSYGMFLTFFYKTNQMCDWVFPVFLTGYYIGRIRQDLVIDIHVEFSRYEDAIRLLKGLLRRIIHDSRRGYWMLRLSVDLEHMNRLNESLSVAEEGILDPCVRAGSRIALQRRVLRLGKPPRRWRIPDYADSVKRKIKEVSDMSIRLVKIYKKLSKS